MKKYSRASLTVEAALICPMFIFVMLFLIYIIIWFQQAALIQNEIVLQARVASVAKTAIISDDNCDSVDDITIPKVYTSEYIPVTIIQKAVTRPFVGVNKISGDGEETIVYITPNGKVYHYYINCSYISIHPYRIGYNAISYSRNKSGGKYSACEICCRNYEKFHCDVYITSYGNRFHLRKDCTAISHEIMRVRLSEVHDMRACSKCGKGR